MKQELMLASWTAKHLFPLCLNNTCDSTYMGLRLDTGDNFPDKKTSATEDVVIYVWYANDNAICLDLRVQVGKRCTENDLELRLKALKALRRKALKAYPNLGSFVRDSNIFAELANLVSALDIKHTLQHGSTDSRINASITIKEISEVLNARKNQMEKPE